MTKADFRILLFGLTLWVSPFYLYAQVPKKAQKKWEAAVKAKKDRDWQKAITLAEQAIAIDSTYLEAHLFLANLLERSGKLPNAIGHYEVLARLGGDTMRYNIAHYKMGVREFHRGGYKEAKYEFDTFLRKADPVKDKAYIMQGRFILKCCEFALGGMRKPLAFSPQPMPPALNGFDMQYFPVLTADGEKIIFTARGLRTDENLYVAIRNEEGWGKPKAMDALNTPYNEGTCTISADGKTLVFTACDNTPTRKVMGSCDLFITHEENGKWSVPQNMGRLVNSRYKDTQPSLNAEGDRLFFASDRPGGYGGYDLYVSKKNTAGVWGKPVNLGKSINTVSNEVSPFIHPNGHSLYFSSDGHIGFGGMDLYIVEEDRHKWLAPDNLGYPLNDHGNQVSLFVSADGSKGIYSEEVYDNGRITKSTLYEFPMLEEIKIADSIIYLKGQLVSAKTAKGIKGRVQIYISGQDDLPKTMHTQSNGAFLAVTDARKPLVVYAEAKGYFFREIALLPSALNSKKPYLIPLTKVEKGAVLTLQQILFESNSSEILLSSEVELDKLAAFMRAQQGVRIEIGGHTDDVGGEEANKQLSIERAESVRQYLIEVGISAERMISKGYGEKYPIMPNNSDKNRAMNRRIEIKIL